MEPKTAVKVKKFAEKVLKDYPDAKVYLFGSRTGKDFLASSDFDVLVVSKKFEGQNFFKRTSAMYAYWAFSDSLDVFCYTPKEFKEKNGQIGFISSALEKARQLA